MLIHRDAGPTRSASSQSYSLLLVLKPKSLFESIIRLGILQLARVQLGSVVIFFNAEACLFVAGIEGFGLDRMTSSMLEFIFVQDDLLVNVLTLHIGRRRKLAGPSHQASLLNHADTPFYFLA